MEKNCINAANVTTDYPSVEADNLRRRLKFYSGEKSHNCKHVTICSDMRFEETLENSFHIISAPILTSNMLRSDI